ncbi:hypothetical protein U1Q18_011395 [Sarracenia purpurea var. burkii]
MGVGCVGQNQQWLGIGELRQLRTGDEIGWARRDRWVIRQWWWWCLANEIVVVDDALVVSACRSLANGFVGGGGHMVDDHVMATLQLMVQTTPTTVMPLLQLVPVVVRSHVMVV